MLQRPKKIIVLRHAEKPTEEGNQRLSLAGVKRAGYISKWLPETFGKPDVIYATAPTAHSLRPLMTVMPLFGGLKQTPIDVSWRDVQAQRLGECLVDGGCAYQIVVVCWHHGKIPALLKGLGVKHHEIPDPWPEDDFSTVFAVSFDDGPDAIVSKHQMSF